MGKIILWAGRALLTGLAFCASVGPDDVGSNISHWLKLFGAENLPAFIVSQSIDQPVAIAAVILIFLSMLPWRSFGINWRIGPVFKGFRVSILPKARSDSAFQISQKPEAPPDIAERLSALEKIAEEQQDIKARSARRAKAAQYLAEQNRLPLPKPSKITSHGYGGARMQIMTGLERQLIEMGVDANTIAGIKSSVADAVTRDAQYLTYGPGDEKHWDNAVEKRGYTIMSMQRDALLNIMKGIADGTSN